MSAQHQKAHALLSLYEKLYYEKYETQAIINKYRDKWGMMDIIDSFGYEETKNLLSYYFKTGGVHNLRNFYQRADDYLVSKRAEERDQAGRRSLMEETKRRVEEEEN